MSEKLYRTRCIIHGHGRCEVSPPHDKPSKECSNVARRHRDRVEVEEQMTDDDQGRENSQDCTRGG